VRLLLDTHTLHRCRPHPRRTKARLTTVVLDASVLLAIILPDERSGEGVARVEAAAAGELTVDGLVVAYGGVEARCTGGSPQRPFRRR